MPNRTCSIAGCANTHKAKGFCSTHYNQTFFPGKANHPRHVVPCTVCGVPVSREARNRYQPVCSMACRKELVGHTGTSSWAIWAADRAKRAGCLDVQVFDAETIFERDRWICQLCGSPVDRTADRMSSNAPTIDHRVPLSHGGSHTPENTQCACLGCNSRKSDRVA